LLAATAGLPVLVFRILDEEKMLVAELRGYDEYRQKIRYRLVPGVW
jgi:protein-S-isoprenylcysteine O-methyltransferase Ste14